MNVNETIFLLGTDTKFVDCFQFSIVFTCVVLMRAHVNLDQKITFRTIDVRIVFPFKFYSAAEMQTWQELWMHNWTISKIKWQKQLPFSQLFCNCTHSTSLWLTLTRCRFRIWISHLPLICLLRHNITSKPKLSKQNFSSDFKVIQWTIRRQWTPVLHTLKSKIIMPADLVNYSCSSSSEDEDGLNESTSKMYVLQVSIENDVAVEWHFVLFSRKLPNPLREEVTTEIPIEISEASAHNGRIRSFAHERGIWTTYVYITCESIISIDAACWLIHQSIEFRSTKRINWNAPAHTENPHWKRYQLCRHQNSPVRRAAHESDAYSYSTASLDRWIHSIAYEHIKVVYQVKFTSRFFLLVFLFRKSGYT